MCSRDVLHAAFGCMYKSIRAIHNGARMLYYTAQFNTFAVLTGVALTEMSLLIIQSVPSFIYLEVSFYHITKTYCIWCKEIT